MKKSGWIVSPAPFLLSRPTVSRMSVITGVTLIPQILFLIAQQDYAAILNVALAIAGTVLAELCMTVPDKKNTFGDGTAILSGLLLGLLLPVTLNPFVSFAVSFSGMLVARVLFGGIGSYWMNPVAVAVSIAYISQPSAFPPFLITADGIQTVGDAFGALKLDHFSQLGSDQLVTGTLNTGFLGFFGIKLPEGYVTLLWNAPSVIPAFRYNILTLVASILLLAMDITDWIIPLCFITVYGTCIWFFSLLPFGAGFSNGDILFALLTSGFLFIAFYVLPEFTTTPRTRAGKAVSGILSGLIAFTICGPGGSAVGGIFTVILINTVNPFIEYAENRYIASSEDLI